MQKAVCAVCLHFANFGLCGGEMIFLAGKLWDGYNKCSLLTKV